MGRGKIIPGVGSLCKNTYGSHSRHNSAPSSILCSAYGVNFNVLTYNTIHTNTKYYTRQMRLSYSCCGKHNFEFPDFGAFNLNHNVTLMSVLHFISQFRRIASAPSPVCTEKSAGCLGPQADRPQPNNWALLLKSLALPLPLGGAAARTSEEGGKGVFFWGGTAFPSIWCVQESRAERKRS